MSYRENVKPRDPVVREPVRWHRWAAAASVVQVFAVAVALDAGLGALAPVTSATLFLWAGTCVCTAVGWNVARMP